MLIADRFFQQIFPSVKHIRYYFFLTTTVDDTLTTLRQHIYHPMASLTSNFLHPDEDQQAAWRTEQAALAARVVTQDDFAWTLSETPLYVAGVDVSFSVQNDSQAIATATIVELLANGRTRLVFSNSQRVVPTVPYVAGYLAFREMPLALRVLHTLPSHSRIHALLVDGNGVLHHRGAGLACHLGISLDIPTIGVAKNLLRVDGLDDNAIRAAAAEDPAAVPLIGTSGHVWGSALLTGNASAKPVYISVGHRICIDTATKLVQRFCKFRVPEPIRWADLHSRQALRTGKLVNVWDEIFNE